MKSTASFVVTTFMSMWATSAFAVSAGAGTLVLTVNAPDEAMALIEIRSIQNPEQVKVVVHQSDDLIHEIDLDVGNYKVIARPLYSEGVRYVPEIGPFVVRVKSQRTVNDDVTYIVSKGVQNLMVTDITESSVSLDWDAELGDDTFVRRVEGDKAASSPSQGVRIPINGSSLTDTGLKPGTTYTYSIFARPGDGAYGRSPIDPVTITVGTVPAAVVVGVPTFVLDPRTQIFVERDYLAATPTGAGVRLDLKPGRNIPPLGSFISLPISETLQGGYLGEVVNVSDDGTTVWLIPAPLASAFDLYRLHIPSFDTTTTGTASTEPVLEALTLTKDAGIAIDEQTLSKEELHKKYRDQANPETVAAGGETTNSYVAPQIESLKTADAADGPDVSLCGPGLGINITTNYDLDHNGHADVSLNTYDTWVGGIPNGVSFDYGYIVYVESETSLEAKLALKCYLPIDSFVQQLTAYPVPILIKAEPKLGVEVTGITAISNFGFNKTMGFRVDGYFEVDYGDIAIDGQINGQIINEKHEITPTSSILSSGVELKAGGTVEFGPGVGTKNAGVLAGVGGEFIFANAGLKGDSLCSEIFLQSQFGLYATVEAWIKAGFVDVDIDKVYEIEQLQKTIPWLGSPWYFPEGCNISEPEDPTDDVVGGGLVVVDSNLSGLSNQWGKVEGFVIGEKTWVLSTGDIKDVVGDPSDFASTDLGQPGNDELSNLSGYTTYDAVTYNMTVIPSGDTLHVRYVFASEEYPEYVGSQYNDVMAVFVNGENCAFVPGTNIPVAVNTINHLTNSQYYIDNQAGSSGYSTSMDGLTVPLTCSVPVTPGVPVTVKISIADASDPFFDSAIALLDGGIWSD